MSLKDDLLKDDIHAMYADGFNATEIANIKGLRPRTVQDFLNGTTWKNYKPLTPKPIKGAPRILVVDIETAPTRAYLWALFNQNIGLVQITNDWYLLSYSAKWYGEDQVLYESKETSWDNEDDYDLCSSLWDLFNEADIVVGQNSKRFDTKKVNARLIINGFKPPSNYRQADTLEIAKRRFNFTSNKLEYLTEQLCTKYKKLKHGKFAGFELWKECLKGNQEAWDEMKEYNMYDVLSTEELWTKLRPWDNKAINLGVYKDEVEVTCNGCDGHEFKPNGFAHTNLSKFTKFVCVDCGWEYRDSVNLIPKNERSNLVRNII